MVGMVDIVVDTAVEMVGTVADMVEMVGTVVVVSSLDLYMAVVVLNLDLYMAVAVLNLDLFDVAVVGLNLDFADMVES